MSLKTMLKNFMPWRVLLPYYKLVDRSLMKKYSNLTPAEVFSDIYRSGKWGPKTEGYYSGSGSSDIYSLDYTAFVRTFIQSNCIEHVVDLGCGDFQIGSQLLTKNMKYTGVDVVRDLIEYNNTNFGSQDTTFLCLDIISDQLPQGDLCIVRQVFQHLSNDQILSIIPRLSQYKFVVITEHHPSTSVRIVHNKDRVHGSGTRVLYNSGVFLDKPPFELEGLILVHTAEVQTPLVAKGETLNTFLMANAAASTFSP